MSVEKNSQNSNFPLQASAPAVSSIADKTGRLIVLDGGSSRIPDDVFQGDVITELMDLVECVCNNYPEFQHLLPEVSS